MRMCRPCQEVVLCQTSRHLFTVNAKMRADHPFPSDRYTLLTSYLEAQTYSQTVKQIGVHRPSDTKSVQCDATMMALTSDHTSPTNPPTSPTHLTTPLGLGIVYHKLITRFLHVDCFDIISTNICLFEKENEKTY